MVDRARARQLVDRGRKLLDPRRVDGLRTRLDHAGMAEIVDVLELLVDGLALLGADTAPSERREPARAERGPRQQDPVVLVAFARASFRPCDCGRLPDHGVTRYLRWRCEGVPHSRFACEASLLERIDEALARIAEDVAAAREPAAEPRREEQAP